MVRKSAKSGLAGKLGDTGRKAIAEHAGDETTFGGGGDLPAAIDGGIAQLVECKFSQYQKGDNEGEYFFYAAGIVKSPTEVDGVNIEGLRTSIMEPLCDTPTRSRPDVESHLAWVLNAFRGLGVDTSEVDIDNLEDVAASLKTEMPHFRFRTWKGEASEQFPNPRVNHDWRGACEYIEDDDDDDVKDDTEESEETEEVPKPRTRRESKSKAEESKEDDLLALAKIADELDEDSEEYAAASEKIEEAADAAGIDYENIESWVGVVEAIDGNESWVEDAKDEDGAPPNKGGVYSFKPPRAKKEVECEVTAVFAGPETCNLKNLDTGKTYKKVSWDKLVAND